MNSSLADNINSEYIQWKNWEKNNFGSISHLDRKYIRAELKYFSRQQSSKNCVLEIGFGNGKFLQYCVEVGWAVTGVEINPLLVEIAQESGFDAICSSDLSELSANQFDLVTAFDVLEHIPQDRILAFLRQINRVLKPKGICLLRFPNGDSPFGLANQNGDITHVSSIGSEKIRYFVNQTSLKLICCRGECEPLIEETFVKTLRRGISLIAKKIINAFIWFIFYKRRYYCSDNLVVILEKTDF